MRYPHFLVICSALLFISNNVLAQTDCATATSSAKQFEVAAQITNITLDAARENWSQAAKSWGQAASTCTGKEQESAKDNARRSTDEMNRLEKRMTEARCSAAEKPARENLDSGASLFKLEKWSESAQAFRNAASQFKAAQSVCDSINPGSTQQSIELAEKNAEIASRNAQATALNARIGICQGHLDKMNKAYDAYQTGLDNAPPSDQTRLIVEASDAANAARQACDGVFRDPQKFAEVNNQIAKAKDKQLACQSQFERTLKLRDELIDFAKQTRKPAEFTSAVKEFMSARRDADDNCEGKAQQQVRDLRNTEFDFLSEEKACLPALRRAHANRSNKPASGICKTKIFAKIAEDLSK